MQTKRTTQPGITRRAFVGGTAAAVAGFTFLPRHVLGQGQTPPSETLRIASIGIAGMGAGDLDTVSKIPGVKMVALCDVDERHAGGSFQKFPDVKRYQDFRKLFDAMEKDIDAVTVSTPDHCHAVAAMAAIQRGKHVYCQKPLAHSVYEVRQLMKAAKEKNVVTQLGNQGHSTQTIRMFREWIEDGAIGKVHTVHCGCVQVNSHLNQLAAAKAGSPVPATLDWDLWQGPTLDRPYFTGYLPGRWRGWTAFGNGTLGDWTCHVVDPVFWALDLGAPKTITAEVKNYDPKTQGETFPAGDHIIFEFPATAKRGAVTLHWYSGAEYMPRPEELEPGRQLPQTAGAIVVGDQGKIMYGSHGAGGVRIIPEEKMKAYKTPPATLPRAAEHHTDWVQAIRSGKKAGSDFSYGGPLSELAMLGVIALKFPGQKLEWDTQAMKFTNYADANAWVNPPYRKGWSL